MISCRQSTEWVVKKADEKLSVKQNLQLLSHLAICSFCRFFNQQNELIDKAVYKNVQMQSPFLGINDKEEIYQSVQAKIKA